VDLRTGQRLWTDPVNAYGGGAAFSRDAGFVVETDAWMCPQATEGWVIAHDRAGKRLWHYRRAGFCQRGPVVEAATDRVFAVFDTGAIVCLAGRTGELLWEARLPTGPGGVETNSSFPCWTPLALHAGRLLALDRDGALHVFNTASGVRLATFAAVGERAPDDKAWNRDEVVAMPWIEGDNLIVASTRGVTAYPAASVLAGEEAPEVRGRALWMQLCLRRGHPELASKEVERLRAARPASPLVLACAAELYEARGEREFEIAARVDRLRRSGLRADPRLRQLTGLVARVSCGPAPTAPLILDGKVLVGSADGFLRAWDATSLEPAGELDAQAGLSDELAAYRKTILFGASDRRIRGASLDLKLLFNWPAPDATATYRLLGDDLVRSCGYTSTANAAILDLEAKGLRGAIEIPGARNAPVVHRGRLYYPRGEGSTASFDGKAVETHPAVAAVAQFLLSASGDPPVAFGTGGTHAVDEHLRPAKLLVPAPREAYAAAASRGIVVTLSHGKHPGKSGLVEAWTLDGQPLALRYGTNLYNPSLYEGPEILPFGDGFLLVAHELAYLDPRKSDPVWRFSPGRVADVARRGFRGPAVHGDHVFFTHPTGGLFVFSKGRVTGAVAEF